MKRLILAILVASAPLFAHAQGAPVVANPDHEAMLRSKDPQLAKNKRLVYDFWREVVEAGHVELCEKYTTEGYIQHNPNFASGRQVLIDMFSKSRKPTPIQAKVQRPIVAIVAEADLVMMSFVNELPDPKDKAKKYTTTGITFFRVENGKISEHWDTGTKNAN
jgi:predicted SnoaL-like aldol condensation-catalyzing enzyme